MANRIIRFATAVFHAEGVTSVSDALEISSALSKTTPNSGYTLKASVNVTSQRLVVSVHGRHGLIPEMLCSYCVICEKLRKDGRMHQDSVDCRHTSVGAKYQTAKYASSAVYSVELVQYRVDDIEEIVAARSTVNPHVDQAALDANYRWMIDNLMKSFELAMRPY